MLTIYWFSLVQILRIRNAYSHKFGVCDRKIRGVAISSSCSLLTGMTRPLLPGPLPPSTHCMLSLSRLLQPYRVFPNNPADPSLVCFSTQHFAFCYVPFALLFRQQSVVRVFSRAAPFSGRRTFFHIKECRRLFQRPIPLPFFRIASLFALKKSTGSF